jgi:hypothetical protein
MLAARRFTALLCTEIRKWRIVLLPFGQIDESPVDKREMVIPPVEVVNATLSPRFSTCVSQNHQTAAGLEKSISTSFKMSIGTYSSSPAPLSGGF